MNPQTLRQLTEQLAHWGESLIAHGRSPLRKIETFPALLTPCGCQSPPLVFWINRDSFMAGAVVFLPGANDSATLEAGRCCAQALGLAYFITWTAGEITFWNARPETPVADKVFKVNQGEKTSSGDFQEGLQHLMEVAKIQAVVAAVPPQELSAYYLANLYRTNLLAVRPILTDAYRVARVDLHSTGKKMPAETLADNKAILTLIRLLSLTLRDQTPAIAQPEDLEQVLYQSLGALPEDLHATLQPVEDEAPLPAEAAVCFHLLFRRLTQLRTATDRNRHCQALGLLLEHESAHLGGFPLPFPLRKIMGPTLLLNPDRFYPEVEQPLEIAPRPILAMTALLRHLRQQPAAANQSTDPWQLPSSTAPLAINGTLAGRSFPDPGSRRAHLALLRTSWPTRRFQLPPRTPEWTWNLLHLLGLAADKAAIELRLPDHWPAADFGQPLTRLIQEQFTLDHLDRDQDGWLRLRLFKTELPGHLCRFLLQDGSVRPVPWEKLRTAHPALFTLALTLPEELYALLDTGRLEILPGDSWPQDRENALYLFTRSALGRYLWQVVSNGRSLPGPKSLRQEIPAAGLPVPEPAALTRLQQVFGNDGEPPPSGREIDRELALWLGSEPALPVAPTPPRRRAAPQAQPDRTELADRISEQVFVDGIPLFPDHYLFDYYRPQLVEYSFDGPLVQENQFFDIFELHDADGHSLQVEGAETARALLLASANASGKVRMSLPVDRQILAAMLERYLADLHELRQALLRETHRLVADPQAADKLVETIWSDRDLPRWALVAEN